MLATNLDYLMKMHTFVHMCMSVSVCVCVPTPTSKVLIRLVWSRSSESVFLKSFQVILMQSVISKTVCKWVLQEIRDHDIGLLVSVPEQAAQFITGPCDSHHEPQLTQNPPFKVPCSFLGCIQVTVLGLEAHLSPSLSARNTLSNLLSCAHPAAMKYATAHILAYQVSLYDGIWFTELPDIHIGLICTLSLKILNGKLKNCCELFLNN